MVSVARFEVRVAAGSGRRELKLDERGRVRVAVTQPPERGKANRAVVELLAEALGVAKRQVRIAKGLKARDKLVEVEGLSMEEAMGRLSASG